MSKGKEDGTEPVCPLSWCHRGRKVPGSSLWPQGRLPLLFPPNSWWGKEREKLALKKCPCSRIHSPLSACPNCLSDSVHWKGLGQLGRATASEGGKSPGTSQGGSSSSPFPVLKGNYYSRKWHPLMHEESCILQSASLQVCTSKSPKQHPGLSRASGTSEKRGQEGMSQGCAESGARRRDVAGGEAPHKGVTGILS